MADLTGIGLVESFRSILQLVQAMQGMAQSIESKAKLTELYGVIVAGQQSALENTIKQQALLEEKNQLKEELAQMKRWEEEKQRYQLTQPWNGCYVYALKESSKGTEPPHWICERCYQEGKKYLIHNGQKWDRHTIQLIKCSHCTFWAEIHGDRERKYV